MEKQSPDATPLHVGGDYTVQLPPRSPVSAGVEGTKEMLRWIWNEGFAAVAGDATSFEVYIRRKSRIIGAAARPRFPVCSCKSISLRDGGLAVGELFDLEEPSRICKEGRWEFFVSAVPFNMPGGVSK